MPTPRRKIKKQLPATARITKAKRSSRSALHRQSSRAQKKQTKKSSRPIRKIRISSRRLSQNAYHARQHTSYPLIKSPTNPIITPIADNHWESFQTFNPAAVYIDNKVHLLYRAIGKDGISVLGYATSSDGVIIDQRSPYPVYYSPLTNDIKKTEDDAWKKYSSGGGWGGCEDPRITRIGDMLYLTYVAFDGWNPPRIALTSISLRDFLQREWNWRKACLISPPNVVDKSGCLFPEKINNKYVMLHRVFPDILIDFLDDLNFSNGAHLQGHARIKPRKSYWDSRKIGAGAPPIKTPYGWLLIYYAVDNRHASQYKIGAMLLDLRNPAKVLYRTSHPILEPVEWYENEGNKAGIAYPCGAVVIDDQLFVYYGGADTVVCVASAPLNDFLQALMANKRFPLRIR